MVTNLDSITKSKLTFETVNIMAKKAFGNNSESEKIIELTDGYFNTAYAVTFTDGYKTVLKVSPPKSVQVMRYEKNIMETEVYVLNKIKAMGTIPAPKVLYYDKSGEIIENEFFFMEFINGSPLDKIKNTLTNEQFKGISSELGQYVRQIHSVKGSYFGYISQEDKKYSTWDEAFLCMIRELLEDAVAAKVVLPYDYDKIYNMIYDKRNVLNSVKESSLVHKDLWEGNIFVDPNTVKITGLIDCERAIYGDTLLEPVCGFLLKNEDFMKNYLGRVNLSKEEEIRVIMYRIYLFLMMVIECPYRKYADENIFKKTSMSLKTVLEELLKI